MAIAALLQGENLLLTGEKATGKKRAGRDTGVCFRKTDVQRFLPCKHRKRRADRNRYVPEPGGHTPEGSIYRCAEEGGFGILDEINMAKNDAVSVLHAALDYRRIIDVPGYDKIPLHPAARMIGTMNYGYAGTGELNEALVSRFW